MRKKLFSGVLFLLLCIVMIACSTTHEKDLDEEESNLITIGFAQVGAESDWRSANSISMRETFSEANGYELIFVDAQQKQGNQIGAIRRFVQQEVDYIVLAPVTEEGWDTVLQEVKYAGIPVIIVDRMVDVRDKNLYAAYVGSNFAMEGAKAGEWIHQFLLQKGIENANIVNIQGTMGGSAQIGRTEGLRAACKMNDNMTLLAEATGEYTEAKSQEVMEEFLATYDNINIVYCENDNEAFGAIKALEAAGKTVGDDIANGEIMVISFDAVEEGMKLVLEGKITLAMECNPLLGPRVQSIIETLEKGETPEKTSYVDEGMYAHDDTVTSVVINGVSYDVTVVTQEVLDERTY